MILSRIHIFIYLLAPLLCISQNQITETKKDYENLLIDANEFYNKAAFDSSIILYEKLNDIAESSLNPELFFEIRIKIIDSYLKLGNFTQANSELIKTQQQIKNKNYSNSFHLSLLCYLDGAIQYKLGKYEPSRIILNKCLNTIKQRTYEFDSLKVLILKSLGNINFKSGKASEALNYYTAAKELEINRRDKPGPLLGSIFLNLALAFDRLKEFDSADVYFMKSIEVKTKYSTNKALLAASYDNYGNYLIQSGKTKKALEYLIQADSLIKEQYEQIGIFIFKLCEDLCSK